MSVTGPPSAPEGGRPVRPSGPHRTFQPVRAAAVVLVSLGVGVAVLARMGGAPVASSSTTTTTVPTASTGSTTTTVATTVPTTTTTTMPPAKVTVLVLNGGTVFHAALYFQTELSAAGYDTLAPNDATSETNKLTQIFVVDPAARGNAVAIAGLLKASPSSVMVPSATNDASVPSSMLQAADVIVVVGADISAQVPPDFETTTTTAAAAG